jgi:hypothetical protein
MATRDFSFKWASTQTTNDTTIITHTSTTSIPIWKYSSLKKIVVKTSSITNPIGDINTNNLNFTLFDRNRSTNPALTDNIPFNLHNELLNFANLLHNHNTLYGQEYVNMYYVTMYADFKTDFYVMGMDRTFNVTYTYNYFEYDTPKSINLPLQFLFNDYKFTPSDVTKYKTTGYTVEEFINAGVQFSQLLDGGYDLMNDLFPALCNKLNIPGIFIDAINSLKNNTLTDENTTLKNANIILITANNKIIETTTTINNTNSMLNSTNTTLYNTNTILHSTNSLYLLPSSSWISRRYPTD